MSVAEFDADVVVDAQDCILGRVASQVAERALDGERVAVVNAEHAVITGREEQLKQKYFDRREQGSDRGPYYPKRPDRLFKRSIRGMLPYKRPRGREALERVRVYVGNPYDEAERLEDTSLDRLSNIRFVSLGDISESLGANITW
jgi:large subunit ribosomal protein L13